MIQRRRRLVVAAGLLLSLVLASVPAQAALPWQVEIVDNSGFVGETTSIALDSNGNPHIAYPDRTTASLKYASWNGSSWSFQTIDRGDVGLYAFVVIDSNDYPHISYYDDANGQLKYAAWNGSNWDIEVVDNDGDVGTWDAMALDSKGNPHISYYDRTNADLKYAVKNGSSWDVTTVDDSYNTGWYTSIALDSHDVPHISYHYQAGGSLYYASLEDSGWSIELVDSGGDVGAHSSLKIDRNDVPHIAYFDFGHASLKYASWTGEAWTTETVDHNSWVGQYCSLALTPNGDPRISYLQYHGPDINNGENLNYASWNGSSWEIETVDSTDVVGYATSLALDRHGYAHISYYDITDNSLKYAKQDGDVTAPTTTASALANGNAYTFGDWTNQSPLTVTLTASDPGGTGIDTTYYTIDGGDPQTYTTPFDVSGAGPHTITYWSTDLAVNEETPRSATIKIDLTAPTLSGAPTSSPNGNGWYNAPVTINWTCADSGGSGIAGDCPAASSITTEGANQTASASVSDIAGNTTNASSSPGVNIDLTDPTVTYAGNQGTYTVDQTISISCEAADSLSGIATTTCVNINEPAYSFALGTTTRSATATDKAGNSGSGSVSFSVSVDTSSLCALTKQFIGNARTGNQLCAPLQLAQLGETMHNPRLKASAINSYILLVNTQAGRGLTRPEANTLIGLARVL